jgi:alpha-tubulin suppressor-like RCC1 family protein
VWAWGDNGFEQFGPGTSAIDAQGQAHQVSGLTGVVDLAAGGYHCLALKGDGTVWSWGNNASGQLGRGIPAGPGPGPVSGLDHVTSFSAGNGHSLAIGHREG